MTNPESKWTKSTIPTPPRNGCTTGGKSQGYFKPETLVEKGLADPDGPAWCITMPPPNVTGALHLGHAMTAAVEDLMTRYYRMRGRETLFLPGADHAGIATQNVVERELAKEGLSRHDLGRETFVEKVWEWKEVYHARITEQHKRLGISCDWDARPLHAGRRPEPRRAHGLCAALRQGPDLPRRLPGQLVPALRERHL